MKWKCMPEKPSAEMIRASDRGLTAEAIYRLMWSACPGAELQQDPHDESAVAARVGSAAQEIRDLFARYGSGDYEPTEEEKAIIDAGLEEVLRCAIEPMEDKN